MSQSAKSPCLFIDNNDLGINKLQFFSGHDFIIQPGHSVCISSDITLKCQLRNNFSNKFQGVLELFFTQDAQTFGQAHSMESNCSSQRYVLLTPKIHCITLELEIPHVFNSSVKPIAIKRHESIGFLQFVIRGFPNFNSFNTLQLDQVACCICNNKSGRKKKHACTDKT